MSFATVIILILLIATIVGGVIVGITLMKNIKGNSNYAPPSPAPASGNSTTATSASSGGGSSGKNLSAFWSIIPLVLAGLWLGAKIILFRGEISNLEIFILAILAIFAWVLDQKKCFISSGILVILAIKLLTPPDMDTIVINKDGVYELPNRPLKVCFTMTGDPKVDFYLDNRVNIDGTIFVQREDGCQNLPKTVQGKTVSISLLSGQPYSQEVKNKIGMNDVNNNYEYYKRVGFGHYPTIQGR
jgi:hypothetical protein